MDTVSDENTQNLYDNNNDTLDEDDSVDTKFSCEDADIITVYVSYELPYNSIDSHSAIFFNLFFYLQLSEADTMGIENVEVSDVLSDVYVSNCMYPLVQFEIIQLILRHLCRIQKTLNL